MPRLTGTATVEGVAHRVGWSRRHLVTGFRAELGVTPKQFQRIARFQASRRALTTITGAARPSLAAVAASAGYAEARIGSSELSLTQARAEWGLHAHGNDDRSSLLLTLTVPNATAVGAAMVSEGATVVIPIEDRSYGKREGRLRDPFGHLWIVSQDLLRDEAP